MSSEVAKALREAADLIEPPGRWTKGTAAKDVAGRKVPSVDPDATSWCIGGALVRCSDDWPTTVAAVDSLCQFLDVPGLGKWNDGQSSAAAVAAATRSAADSLEAT